MEQNLNNESFSAYLKSEREKKGIRLEEIASITKIHLRSLELLETGKWSQLPPDPFLRGFIVAYAKYIGLDANEAIKRFLNESSREASNKDHIQEVKTTSHFNTSAPKAPPSDLIENPPTIPFKKIFLIAGGISTAILFFVVMRIGKQSFQVEIKPQEVIVAVPVLSENKEIVAENNTTPAPTIEAKIVLEAEKEVSLQNVKAQKEVVPPVVVTSPNPTASSEFTHDLVVEGKERTWLKIVYDNEPPKEIFLPAGQKVTYQAKEKIKLVLGNSTGTVVTHNGESSEGVKLQGTIRQYLFPGDARFPQDQPKRVTTNKANGESKPTEEKPTEKNDTKAAESTN